MTESGDFTVLLPDLRYDCLRCGKGCAVDFTVLVSAAVEEGIDRSQAGQRVRRDGYQPVRLLDDGRRTVGRRENGECVFLGPDRLCSIHSESGLGAKPRPCRQFPFHPINTPDGFYIGLSFFCSAVQRDHGRPLHLQTEEIKGAVSEQFLETPPASLVGLKIPVGPDMFTDWAGYRALETVVLRGLEQDDLLAGLWNSAARVGLAFLHHLYTESPFEASSAERAGAPPLAAAWSTIESVAASLVSVVEASGEARTAVAESYLRGEPFSSRDGTRQLRANPGQQTPEWFDGQAHRYFEHVIFRKFLAQGPVVGRAFALCALHRVLRFYTFDSARRAGREEPVVEDFHQALDVVEIELMLHADGLAPLYDHLQYSALSILDPA